MEALVLTGRPEEAVGVVLVLQESGAVNQSFGGVPDQVTDGFFGIDAQQVLENVQERNFLRSIGHLLENAVKHVQVGVKINAVRAIDLCLVALALLVKHIQLDLQIRVRPLPLGVVALTLDNFGQFQPDKLVPDAVSVLKLRRRDDQAVDEGEQDGLVLSGGLSLAQLVHHDLEPVPLRLERLVVLQGLERPAVALGTVHTQG